MKLLLRSLLLSFSFVVVGAVAHAEGWNLPSSPVTGTNYSLSYTTSPASHGNTITLWKQAPGSSSWTSTGGGGGSTNSPITAAGSVTFDVDGVWSFKACNGPNSTSNTLSQVTQSVSPNTTPTTFSFSNLSFTYDGATKTASVTPSPSNATYDFNLTGGPNVGSYSVSATATGNFTGSGSDTLTISAGGQADVAISPGSQTVPVGTTITFTVSGGGVGGYNWGGSASGTGSSSSVTFNSVGGFVVTVSSPGDGNYSASNTAAVTIMVADQSAPSAPSGLNATGTTATSFTLNWTASSDDVGVAGYQVTKNGVSVGTTTGTSMNIPGLSQGTTYAMQVRSYDGAPNYSGWSSTLNVQTTDTQLPTVPTGLTPSAVTATSFTLGWTASTDNIGVTGYRVYKNGTLLTTVTATNCSVTGLTNGTTYAMTVAAGDAAGNWSAQSSTLNVPTTDTQAPTVPTGLSATSVTLTSFVLSWTPSTDNVGVANYRVYKNGSLLTTVATNSANITGLTPGTTYAMTVSAGDAAGNWSGQSGALNVPTTADTAPPSVPVGLVASNRLNTSFSLNWGASTDNVAVTGYRVYRAGTLINTVTTTSANISGLLPSTQYSMTVSAGDAAGNWSAPSTALPVTTTGDPNADADGDGVPDVIEAQMGTSPNSAAQSDSSNQTQLKTTKPQ